MYRAHLSRTLDIDWVIKALNKKEEKNHTYLKLHLTASSQTNLKATNHIYINTQSTVTVLESNLLCVCCVEIREAFRVLDRDGNGFISKQELGMAMRSLGYMPSEVELAIIMQRLDMDGEDTRTQGHTLEWV